MLSGMQLQLKCGQCMLSMLIMLLTIYFIKLQSLRFNAIQFKSLHEFPDNHTVKNIIQQLTMHCLNGICLIVIYGESILDDMEMKDKARNK